MYLITALQPSALGACVWAAIASFQNKEDKFEPAQWKHFSPARATCPRAIATVDGNNDKSCPEAGLIHSD